MERTWEYDYLAQIAAYGNANSEPIERDAIEAQGVLHDDHDSEEIGIQSSVFHNRISSYNINRTAPKLRDTSRFV